MSGIFVHGVGAISPAGWKMESLRKVFGDGTQLPAKNLARPGWDRALPIRQVPPLETRPAFLAHARLRRASPISHYVVAAAMEALGSDAQSAGEGKLNIAVVLCVMSGCVNYSRRFYDEVLRDPATASPLVFPETVFNAPASHLAALLGVSGLNYTLVGDPGTFLMGVSVGAKWLMDEQADGCVIVGAEEADWLTSDAFRLFSRSIVLSDGAGALYLKRESSGALAELHSITDAHSFTQKTTVASAAKKMRQQLPDCSASHLLVDSRHGLPWQHRAEETAWDDWNAARISLKAMIGEGLMAGAAWQCAAAVDALGQNRYTAASVSIVGCNEQAIGAHFVNSQSR